MRNKQYWFRLATTVAIVATLSVVAMAAEEGHGKGKSVLELFRATGLVGILLLLLSIGGVAVTIENILSLRFDKLCPPDLEDDLQALIDQKEFAEAQELCDTDNTYVAKVVGAGLKMREAGYEEMVRGLEQSAAAETFKLNAKLALLSLLGNIGPLLGLLGTVTGMITSFQKIEQLKAPTPGDLAVGVYESLVNTTMGLFVAITFLTIYFLMKNKVTKMTLDINLRGVQMLKGVGLHGEAA
ncbi:MAG: MotA/TolQ/ExbB proton channel family protein [Planctomycetota bacterium]